MGDTLFQIVICILFGVILVVGYACLVMASEQERISEEDWKKFEEEHKDKEDSL